MRLVVDGGGYIAAASMFRSGNQLAALTYDALAGRLQAYGGMAGDDATSTEFAAAYDTAARQALDALADLSRAFTALGRLTHASARHHQRADAEAAEPFRTSAYTGDDLHEDDYVLVSPAGVPSSVGAQEPGLGEVETWILDRIEGFVWPGADTGRLRDAATTWRRTASGVLDLLDHCDRATSELGRQRSPEIPLALDAVAELRGLIREAADQMLTLADSCDDYAAQVEQTHARTRALLAEIVQMLVEGVVLSVAVGMITGGTATSAVAGATLARVTAQAPRFHALLTTLRTGASLAATRVRAAEDGLTLVRARLEKFLKVQLRDERGALNLHRSTSLASPHIRPTPKVESQRLGNLVANLFKGTTNPRRTGDGTTMDAIRAEIATGESTHGRMHFTKGKESLRGLENWLRRNPEASTSDRRVAQELIAELKDALGQ